MAKQTNRLRELTKSISQNANADSIKKIKSEELLDFPENERMGYSVEYTADLEESIQKSGFSDPLEVCKINDNIAEKMNGYSEQYKAGAYVIISGHRRRKAGCNTGMKEFPCIVRDFSGYIPMRRSVLEANMHRGKGGNPLQLGLEIRAWKEQLDLEGMKKKGDIEKSLQEIFGKSRSVLQRYESTITMIPKVQDLVEKGYLNLTDVTPLGNMDTEKQNTVICIFDEYLGTLQSELLGDERYSLLVKKDYKKIIDAVKDNKTSWEEINESVIVPIVEQEERAEVAVTTKKTEDAVSEQTGEVVSKQTYSIATFPQRHMTEDIQDDTDTQDEDAGTYALEGKTTVDVVGVSGQTELLEEEREQLLREFINYYYFDKEKRKKLINKMHTGKRDKMLQEYESPNGHVGQYNEKWRYTFYGYANGIDIEREKKKMHAKYGYKEFADTFVSMFSDEYYSDDFSVENEEDIKEIETRKKAVDRLIHLYDYKLTVPYNPCEKTEMLKKLKLLKNFIIDEISELE